MVFCKVMSLASKKVFSSRIYLIIVNYTESSEFATFYPITFSAQLGFKKLDDDKTT